MLDTSRSDVNILVAVNPMTKQILMVNTPRDYYVPNPASNSGAKDKLTHCGVYGIRNSMQALSGLYDVSIDYYAQINFNGFATLINALGGITVQSEQEFFAEGCRFRAGENKLDGRKALVFARERDAFAGGDSQRDRNQMKVMTAVLEKLTSTSRFIEKFDHILDRIQGMFVTSMSRKEMAELVQMQVFDEAKWNIRTFDVSGRSDVQPVFSAPGFEASVIWPDEKAVSCAHDLMEGVLAGQILPEAD